MLAIAAALDFLGTMTPIKRPIISVIVPVWNGANDIGRLLSALSAQDAPEESFEVIVVDNGSTDNTAARVNAVNAGLLLHEPKPGSYRARNRGVTAARGEWLLFTDADCIPQSDWISIALRATVETPDAGIVGGAIHLFNDGGSPELDLFERLTSLNQQAYIANGHCITANWLCRKTMLEAVGGFDAGLLSGGDMECSKRIAATGAPLRFEERMIVRHPIRTDMAGLIAKRRRIVGGVWTMQGEGWRTLLSANIRFGKWWLALIWRMANSDAPLPVRLKAMCVASRLYGTSIAESARLFFGARPYRS